MRDTITMLVMNAAAIGVLILINRTVYATASQWNPLYTAGFATGMMVTAMVLIAIHYIGKWFKL